MPIGKPKKPPFVLISDAVSAMVEAKLVVSQVNYRLKYLRDLAHDGGIGKGKLEMSVEVLAVMLDEAIHLLDDLNDNPGG